MVMEATPSPQSVGREFVRQYYTLLNKAPHHLHRFYNHQSSFVHGGLEPVSAATAAANSQQNSVVIGQKQIHNKIQQLNFRDCHAKISQVDAQATLGNGVVVLVTGELSNDGQPMRRFTQTFVLAPQAPKKYYVHNDIFRYQDCLWDDEQLDGHEQDSDARSEEVNDTEAVDGNAQHAPLDSLQQQAMLHQAAPAGQVQPVDAAAVLQQQPQMFYNAGAVKPAPGMFPNPPAVPMNGLPQQPPVNVVPQTMPAQQQPQVPVAQQTPATAPFAAATPAMPESQQTVNAAPVAAAPVVVAAVEKPVEVVPEEKKVAAPAVVEEAPAPVEKKPAEPATFASLVKSGGGAGRVMSSRGPGAAPVQPVSVVSSQANSQPQQQQQSRDSNRDAMGGGNNMRERRSSTNQNGPYGDSQQLFVGNIPHHATEEDLKAMFSKYGVVLDLRIYTKQNQAQPAGGKGTSGRIPQNYGFVTFKESESAQAVLANTNISFPDDSPDGQKLNIEEKMQRVGDRDRRDRGMGGGGMNGGMGNGSRGMGRGGMQGSGGAGMMRNSGGPRGNGAGDGRNGTGPRSGNSSGGGGGGSYNRSQVMRNGNSGGGGGLTASGAGGNTYGGRR